MSFNKISSDFVDLNVDNYIPKITTSSIADQGYRLYNDSSAIPVDGTGGTTTGLTLAPDTTTILTGVANLRFAKDASNRQGLGVSKDFTVNNNHLGRVLQFTFDASLISGTYATGDIKIYFIQDPTGTPVVIEPVNVQLQLGIAGIVIKHIATFQTHITLKDYRLCIHVASTSASAYTIDFNNFKIWEPSQNYGAIITDWQTYTPTFQGFGTVTDQVFKWRRVGSSCEIQGIFKPGTPSAVQARVTLPNGYLASLSTISSGEAQIVGYMIRDISSTTSNFSVICNNNFNYMNFGFIRSNSSANPFTALNGDEIMNSGDDLSFYATIPIQGWGSNMILSSEAGDGRLVTGSYYGISALSLTANVTTLKFNTIQKDNHNIYNSSTGTITIPYSGDYFFSVGSFYTTGGSGQIQPYINGVLYDASAYFTQSTYINLQFYIPNLKSGDTVDFRCNNSYTLTSIPNVNFSWFKLGASNQIIAPVETVGFRATRTTNSAQATGAIDVIMNSSSDSSRYEFDTHGCYNTTTGVITIPMTGVYDFSASLYINGTFTASFSDQLYLTDLSNNYITTLGGFVSVANYALINLLGIGKVRLLAGQQVKVRLVRSNDVFIGGTTSQSSSNAYSWIAMSRVGI